MRAWVAVALIAAVGCGPEGQDIKETTDPSGLGAPDVAGSYSVETSDEEGCEDAPLEWLAGPLTVSGPADALEFSFASGPSLAGLIDETFTFEVIDSVDVEGWALDVDLSGLAYIEGDLWVLDGDVFISGVPPGTAPGCSYEARVIATQDP